MIVLSMLLHGQKPTLAPRSCISLDKERESNLPARRNVWDKPLVPTFHYTALLKSYTCNILMLCYSKSKLSGASETPEACDTIQRDLGKHKKSGCVAVGSGQPPVSVWASG